MLRIPEIIRTFPVEDVGAFENYGEVLCEVRQNVNFQFETDLYSVTINGRDCPVRSCRESRIPFNRPWPGKQRDISQTEIAGFITFSADEEVTLEVTSKKDFSDALVRPLSKNVTPEISDGKIRFKLTEPGGYVLELGTSHEVLHIFFNPLKEYPDKESATYYFGPGIHSPGVINLRDNDSVYIDEEAIVFGSINSLGAKNVRIYGGGILDNTNEERITEHCYSNTTKGTFRVYNCHNMVVEDIILMNSANWVLAMFYCSDIVIDNIKIIGQWRYNTDGIDICNCHNVTIRNSFVRSFDDTITIKGIYDYDKPIENIVTDNCVLWCGWGHVCEIGIETHAAVYRNVVFKNCDIIHSQLRAMAVANGNPVLVHDVDFENINIELQAETLPEQMQMTDDDQYTGYDKSEVPYVIHIANHKYSNMPRVENGRLKSYTSDEYGKTRDVRFKNIRIMTDEGCLAPHFTIKSLDENVKVRNISIDGLYLNGVRQTDLSAFGKDFANSENITLDGEIVS